MSKVETQFLKTDLHISKFGAKLAIKDGLFELSWFDENKNLQKETYSPLKVKSLCALCQSPQQRAVFEVSVYAGGWDGGGGMRPLFAWENAQTLQRFKEQVHGNLNFLRFVRGDGHRSFLRLKMELG